jgi:hypothetical protein
VRGTEAFSEPAVSIVDLPFSRKKEWLVEGEAEDAPNVQKIPKKFWSPTLRVWNEEVISLEKMTVDPRFQTAPVGNPKSEQMSRQVDRFFR